jgi:hypothetical protein
MLLVEIVVRMYIVRWIDYVRRLLIDELKFFKLRFHNWIDTLTIQ